MTNLKNNINHYMKLKNIRMYSHLLADIGRELGYKGQEAYQFAKNEKCNFSKMLKGERPLKYEFIIPLEKIFGVSLARLTEEDAYKLPVERENVPFVKGFSYYASLDDPELYEKELDWLLDKDGKSILNNSDEFGMYFLDYVAKYGSVNGVRYIYDHYKPKMKWYNQFEFDKEKGLTWLQIENAMPLATLIAGMKDAEMFYSIYDSYTMFFTNGHYGNDDCLFNTDEYLELIMDSDHLFKALFADRTCEIKLSSYMKRKTGKESITYHSPNPILNNCLRYALKHLPKYRKQAIAILRFGAEHNRKVFAERDGIFVLNEFGDVRSAGDGLFRGLAIVADENGIKDDEIAALIKKLPEFPDGGGWRQ